MKTRIASMSLSAAAGLGLLAASALNVTAQISVASDVPASSSPGQTAPVKLSYGVAEVLKLANAHVSEDTILAYIQNSGRIYNLTVNEIVYLKEQGMSDHVLTAMLDQRHKMAESAAQIAQSAPATPQASYASASTAQYAPVAAQPAATYAQAAPAAAPASTVYVMPSSSASYVYPGAYPAYYGGYPYYGGYAGYAYPGLSIGLGFGIGGVWCGTGWYGGCGYGGYRGWGGYYGGYRGGGFYGGGYHGGHR